MAAASQQYRGSRMIMPSVLNRLLCFQPTQPRETSETTRHKRQDAQTKTKAGGAGGGARSFPALTVEIALNFQIR